MNASFIWPMPANFKVVLELGGEDRRVSLGKGTLTTSDGEWQHGNVLGIDPEQGFVEFQPNRADTSQRLPFARIKSLRLNDVVDLSRFELPADPQNSTCRPASIKQKCTVHFKSGAPLIAETAGFVLRDYGLFLFLIVNSKVVTRFFIPVQAIDRYEIDGQPGQLPGTDPGLSINTNILEVESHGQKLTETLVKALRRRAVDEFVMPDLDITGAITHVPMPAQNPADSRRSQYIDENVIEFGAGEKTPKKPDLMSIEMAGDDPLLQSLAAMENVSFEEHALEFDKAWQEMQQQAPAQKTGNLPGELSAAEQSEMLVNEIVEAFDMGSIKTKKQEHARTQKLDSYQQRQNIVTPQQVETALLEQKARPQVRLGEALLQENLITENQLSMALLAQSRDRRQPLGDILVGMGVIDRKTIRRVLAQKLGIPFVNLRKFQFEPNVVKAVPADFAREHMVMPLFQTDGRIVVALEDPMQSAGVQELVFLIKQKVDLVMASAEDLEFIISQMYGEVSPREHITELVSELGSGIESEADAAAADVTESDNTLVRLVNKIIMDAYEQGVSDIHIEIMKGAKPTRVRFRKDGVMFHYSDIPANFRNALIARIKIMSRLDISEKRRAQDGKISFDQFGPAKIELRVATIPTAGGLEDIVMRILAAPKSVPLDGIGLAPDVLKGLQTLIQKPHGLIFVCGPTGSGKTTTLHALLGYINTPDRKIWTAEDPIEITQEGLRQVQVQAKIDWTFANVLRSFMRADPDVIMVGETRDPETARTVIEASLTGHLVLSTMHTNSAAESVVRLLDLGLDPFNFADALIGVLAQRLARRLCTSCRKPVQASDEQLDMLAHEYCFETEIEPATILAEWRGKYADKKGKITLNQAVGCPLCDQCGYKGRLGVHELLISNPTFKKQIHTKANGADMLRTAVAGGMRTLRQDGIDKILQGHTDWEQIKTV